MDEVLRSAYLCVCLSLRFIVCSHISKTTVQITPDFLYVSLAAVAWSTSDGNVYFRFCGWRNVFT